MTPTERAEGLLGPTRAALDAIDSILVQAEPFDPAKSNGSLALARPTISTPSFYPT